MATDAKVSPQVTSSKAPAPSPLQRRMSFAKGSKSFDSSSFAHLIEKTASNDPEKTPMMEVIRLKVKKWLAASFFGRIYVYILLILSVLSCAQYIYQTYLNENDPQDKELLNIFALLELFLAALFAFDWCLHLFLADHRWDHFFSFFAMVDFTTVIPIWLTYYVFTNPVEYHDIHNVDDAINYALRGAYTLRILRALRVHRLLVHIEDEVERFLSQMLLSVVTMILFDSAIMQYLEKQQHDEKFHTWMYFLVVSISTVGYGDISPGSTLGRFMAMFFICFAIIFVPKQTNELIEKMNQSSVWARHHYKPRGNTKHVLICGDLRSTSLLEFFSELFHEDHENMNLNAVILQPEPPSSDMHAVLRDPIFSIVTHYLEGSPLNDSDLMRAKANQAIAIFLMGNKFSSNPDEEDAKTILQQFSIRRFITSTQSCDPLFCLQLIRPENRRHLATEDPDSDKELVVCLNEMKMGVIAKTCMFPGTGTMIFNLLTSFAEDDDDDNDAGDTDGPGSDEDCSEDDMDDGGSWMQEYQRGCDWEIYTTEMAEVFEGARFCVLSQNLYSKLGVVLFALRIRELKGKGHVRVLLNPADYVIPSKDKYFVEGFVIAKNKASSDLSFQGIASSDIRSSQLSLIANAITKTAEAGTSAFRRQSMAVGMGARGMKHSDTSGGPVKHTNAGWQTIMSQYENQDVNQNQQEALQKIEDENLRRNYFVRDVPNDLAESIVKTSVLEEYPYMNGHMIVIAKGLSNLYDFIRPLRAKYLGRLRHIVLLYPYDIPHSVWRRISIFEGILVVRGSPLEESDIRRAGIFRAQQVVVLADPNSDNGNQGIDALVDADAIFTYHCVRRLNEKAQIMIEIVRHQNVGYLDPSMSVNTHDADYKFTPQFAAGTLFTSSMLDSIVCQAFYNPQIIRVLDKLISGTDCVEDQKNRNPLLANKRPKVGIQAVTGSALYQIPIPDNLESKTYGSLFKHLCKDGILPLGLLRGVFTNMSMGAKSNKMSYVFTNPSKDTELFTCDRVFVLSQKVLTSSKSTAREVLESFMQATAGQTQGGRRRTVDDSSGMDVLKEEFQDISNAQRTLERAMTSLTLDMSKKFDDMLELVKSIKRTNDGVDGAVINRSNSRRRMSQLGSDRSNNQGSPNKVVSKSRTGPVDI
mmetsp:Transcript_23872/g.35024  ORF Transcript_23872/g.35024 Transcript_23872/m.35024 type:complete len:1148 (-) Transcript_23872:179-3622(-)|eukprot:CAMPEP_0185036124 /NCGR_PEP_ID=MMETSP1103-20130426/28623_1 /TAXON_ID=36769 /ORGANISM="Paraphysomonas bandaiensis, Strain Caron Lab Isolate" /LENGTH=1147 /DNA_ID=CAMNT_0027573527 /DNA_START=106 /DNA_END=3549 /DNA_ORIENTATION=-